MNVIHEMPIGDLNGNSSSNEAKANAAIVLSKTSLTNDTSISSTSNNTKITISTTTTNSNGGSSDSSGSSETSGPKPQEAQGARKEESISPAPTNGEAAEKKATETNGQGINGNAQTSASSNGNADPTTTTTLPTNTTPAPSDDLKIIGHIKSIEKINEKRRLFLNNTISEHRIDEKCETEKRTQTVNGCETVISETHAHTREEQREHKVDDDGAKFNESSAPKTPSNTVFYPCATTAAATSSATTKYATLPRLPGSPPPKPPMLSRTRSIGIGDQQRSYSATTVPTSPTAGGGGGVTTAVKILTSDAPLATPTPTTTSTPTTPTNTPTTPTKTPTTPTNTPTTPTPTGTSTSATSKVPSGTTLITSTVLPEPIKVSTVQLREDPMPAMRRIMERPMSLSPAAPKQISVNHYERLIEELKCPGCAYPMKSPILLCKTGHSICQQCTRVLLLCPLCKEPFTNIRSLTVEALCSKAHFRCSNAAGGCTVRLQIDLLSWHEKQCIYKPMKCFIGRVWGDCDWSGREAHWKDHLEREHADKVFHTQTTDMVWNMGVKQKPLTGYYVFIVYDEMFNFYEVHDKERILFTMACTSTVKEKKHNYAFEVTIVHQENEAIAITQKYPVHSEYDNDILAEGTCISMSLTDLAKFIDEDRLLHYRVRIVEIKTPRKSKNSSRSSPNTSVHPTDFQQTQIEGVNLKSVPAEVIVTRKLEDLPYVDNSNAATPRSTGGGRGGAAAPQSTTTEGVSETEGERVKVKNIYNGKFSSNDSGSESDPEFEAFIAKKWGTPQLHFNRKFLKNNSNESNSPDEMTGSLRRLDRRYAPEDKMSMTSTSTSYKKRVANQLRKSFRGFKTPQIFGNNNTNNNKKASASDELATESK